MNDRHTLSYRVGGDEFVVLFTEQGEEAVASALRQIREKVAAAGYSLSIGYAMKTQDQTLDDALRISDQNMYKEKAEYYQSSGRDRRMRQGDKS